MRLITTAPQCANTGCTRDSAYDSEDATYYSTCERCILQAVSAAGLHAHRHSFTAVQAAANGGPRTWTTSTTLRPVVEGDEIVGWECEEYLPQDRGPCGYTVSRADMDAYRAFRRGEAFLCSVASSAQFGHGVGPQTDGREVWDAFNALRAAWTAAHPVDVR